MYMPSPEPPRVPCFQNFVKTRLRIAGLIPVALLSALVAVQVFSTGHRLVVDERAAGLAAAVGLLLLRAPFLAVVFGAALTAGLLRLL